MPVAPSGDGLMIGVELVKDRKNKTPAKEECAQVLEKAREFGLLVGKGGLFGNTLRIKPPMCLTIADADFLLEEPAFLFNEGLVKERVTYWPNAFLRRVC